MIPSQKETSPHLYPGQKVVPGPTEGSVPSQKETSPHLAKTAAEKLAALKEEKTND